MQLTPLRRPGRRDRRLVGALTAGTVVLALGLGAAACGSDSDGSSTAGSGSSSSSGTSPEERQVTDADVTAGLQKMPALFAAAVAAAGTGDAAAKFEAIEENWREFEGTVRTKEPDLYISFEDELSNLKKAMDGGDSAKAAETKAKLESIAGQYQAKHP
jgi:hypothetical protein